MSGINLVSVKFFQNFLMTMKKKIIRSFTHLPHQSLQFEKKIIEIFNRKNYNLNEGI